MLCDDALMASETEGGPVLQGRKIVEFMDSNLEGSLGRYGGGYGVCFAR